MNYSFEREISETERRIRAGGAALPRTQRAREYLDLLVRADAALEAVYKTAPDIFSDVWCLLGEIDSFETMRLKVAQAIKDAEGSK